MADSRMKQESLVLKEPADFSERMSKGDMLQEEKDRALRQKYRLSSPDIQPLSQREQEHLTYLAVYEKYGEYKRKRQIYRFYGSLFILISAVVFLLLMFSLEEKITFLCLWIITIIFCVVMMIRMDYLYHTYKEMLGLCDEYDWHEMEDIESGQPSETSAPAPHPETASADAAPMPEQESNRKEGEQ